MNKKALIIVSQYFKVLVQDLYSKRQSSKCLFHLPSTHKETEAKAEEEARKQKGNLVDYEMTMLN